MSTIAVAFVAGIAFGTGTVISVMFYMIFRKSGQKKISEYNEETIRLLHERNIVNARIAKALEDLVAQGGDK